MNTGYIKVFRKLLDWEWINCPEMVAIWVNLLLRANTDDCVLHGRTIRRGQLVVSRRKLALWCGLSERAVRTCIARLQASSEVIIEATQKTTQQATQKTTQQATQQATIITICKYEDYQDKRPIKRQASDPKNDPTSDPKNDHIIRRYKEISIDTNVSLDTKKVGEKFEKFRDWISRHAPSVAEMRQPFTEEQFEDITATYTAEDVRDVLEEMENWAKLGERKSAYLTCRSWLRRRHERGATGQHAVRPVQKLQTTQSVNEQWGR